MKSIMESRSLKGVFEYTGRDRGILTKSLIPGISVYGEYLVNINGVEYREWNHTKSKLGAAIVKGATQIGIREGSVVLYLGAASGTTVSHVSDIVGNTGLVFALDFAPRVMRDLMFLCEDRPNIVPIYADANKPDDYSSQISQVDVVFQDVAQKNQLEIFLKNCERFLKSGGFGLISIKARSIDVTKHPKDIFMIVRRELEKKMIIADYRELAPFEKDHALFILKKK